GFSWTRSRPAAGAVSSNSRMRGGGTSGPPGSPAPPPTQGAAPSRKDGRWFSSGRPGDRSRSRGGEVGDGHEEGVVIEDAIDVVPAAQALPGLPVHLSVHPAHRVVPLVLSPVVGRAARALVRGGHGVLVAFVRAAGSRQRVADVPHLLGAAVVPRD